MNFRANLQYQKSYAAVIAPFFYHKLQSVKTTEIGGVCGYDVGKSLIL
jgi:hypothetical protein